MIEEIWAVFRDQIFGDPGFWVALIVVGLLSILGIFVGLVTWKFINTTKR